jgi:hypothetical protein
MDDFFEGSAHSATKLSRSEVKKVKFTQAALRAVDLAAAFHEGRKEGLGVEFYERVDEVVASIRQNPEGYRKLHKDLRHCNLRQFTDWGLWFRLNRDNSMVVACLSGRRNPALAKERGTGIIPFPEP